MIGSVFFEDTADNAVTVNFFPCREMMNNFIWPQIAKLDPEETWFQQDGASYHTAYVRMGLLNTKFEGRVIPRHGDVDCPLRSCDLTSLDSFLWDFLKEKGVCQ